MKVSDTYRDAHNDLVNLIPVIGELNARRGNRPFGEVPCEYREHGSCDVEFSSKYIETRPELSGNLARRQLYMYVKYGAELNLKIPDGHIKDLMRASLLDPPDQLEVNRNRVICSVQGTANTLVSNCK
jgi:endonuclease I